jgi:lipopolysaccharide export system permease protein
VYKLQKYILKNYSTLFFQLFFILFAITSIIFLIKIATDTSILKISFKDLGFMYLMQVPIIIFFAAPISFFAASTINLARYSTDSEMVVLFSFGMNPKTILKIYFKVALLISTSMLILSIGVIPITQQLMSEFINIKKYEAKLNVKSTEFGQSLGEWLLFVNDSKDNLYLDVIMMSLKKEQDKIKFIISKSTTINKNNNIFKMNLENGEANLIGDKSIELIKYNNLKINDINNYRHFSFLDIGNYWGIDNKTRFNSYKKEFSSSILIAIFPLISLYFILILGIINPRRTNNRINLYIFGVVVGYFSIGNMLSFGSIVYTLVIFPISWLTISYIIYRKKFLKDPSW